MTPLIFARIINALGKPFGINPFPRAFANSNAYETSDRRAAFDAIYTHNGWNSDESQSGPGSEVKRAEAYRIRLTECLHQLRVTSIFDAPCGDLNWILPTVKGIHYIGGDIVPALISDLRLSFPDLDLRVFDICQDKFPVVDVWHCRDCLFHLPLADIRKALENFACSVIPYALITTHRTRLAHRNLDIPVGGWRYLDLTAKPLTLPPAIKYLRDYQRGRDFPRFVGLWTREQIRDALA